MFYWFIASFFSALGLTGLIRRYALASDLMDMPNYRSSHVLPTPRGGGLSFVIVFLSFLLLSGGMGWIALNVCFAFIGAGLMVSGLGFLDDYGRIALGWRLGGHFFASAFALFWLGGMPSVSVMGFIFPAGMVLNGLTVLSLVWLINLYNFMDGIDGLAGVEALSVCMAAGSLYCLTSGLGPWVILIFGLAAAVAGFLVWNFPSARIFMGDAGSGFLGLMLGLFMVQSAHLTASFFWIWLILLGVFIVDATVTLLRRFVQGDKVYEAHCTHAYQHLSKRLQSHCFVTLAVLCLNVFWLFPIAAIVLKGWVDGPLGFVIAYIPLVILALKAGAGQADTACRYSKKLITRP